MRIRTRDIRPGDRVRSYTLEGTVLKVGQMTALVQTAHGEGVMVLGDGGSVELLSYLDGRKALPA